MAILADRIVVGVKRRVKLPAKRDGDNDILAFASQVISGRIVPLIESLDQNFFTQTSSVPLVPGQRDYQIPARAIGRSLIDLQVMGQNESDVKSLSLYQETSGAGGFKFVSDRVSLLYDPSGYEKLVFTYRIAPSYLCLGAEASKVLEVNGYDVVVSSVPATFVALDRFDFIDGTGGGAILALDQLLSGIDGTTLTFAVDTVPGVLKVGDYISLAATSPVVNFMPNEVYTLIESLTCYRILEALADYEALKAVDADIQREERDLKQLLEPRMDSASKIIMNRYGLVRGRHRLPRFIGEGI